MRYLPRDMKIHIYLIVIVRDISTRMIKLILDKNTDITEVTRIKINSILGSDGENEEIDMYS